mmetsp:Transcript_14291/g.30704  ORF Transcript_14291/g.30704 Transcript_14291/m.30704 type:complete len:202 (+) Transcript_14291:375-980(+)
MYLPLIRTFRDSLLPIPVVLVAHLVTLVDTTVRRRLARARFLFLLLVSHLTVQVVHHLRTTCTRLFLSQDSMEAHHRVLIVATMAHLLRVASTVRPAVLDSSTNSSLIWDTTMAHRKRFRPVASEVDLLPSLTITWTVLVYPARLPGNSSITITSKLVDTPLAAHLGTLPWPPTMVCLMQNIQCRKVPPRFLVPFHLPSRT